MPKPVIPVAAAVVRYQSRILVARRAPGDALAGLWEFPGGKIEAGESPQACLVREFQEELGLAIEVEQHVMTVNHPQDTRTIALEVYHAHAQTNRVQCHVHDQAKWVTLDELSELDFAPADRPVVKALLASTGEEGDE